MKKMVDRMLFFAFLTNLLCFVSWPGLVAHADENEDVSGATGFTYSIQFPENQMESDLGYFKLKMKPDQEQIIAVSLSNPSTESVNINVRLNGAKTNQNGVIEYGDSTIENDPSLKVDFTDIVTGPATITLEAGETKPLELQIKMPESGIDGVVAGGIQLMREEQETQTSGNGSKIINQYAYVIGILLQETEELPAADLALNRVYADQDNYRNAILADFSNVEAAYLNDMTVDVQVNKRGSSSVLYERKQTGMRMAPNTFIRFPVSMNGERMIAGAYTANILVTSGDRKWEWSEDFDITNAEADKYNERDVGLVPENGLDWQLIAIIVMGVIVLTTIILFLIMIVNRKLKVAKKRKKRQR